MEEFLLIAGVSFVVSFLTTFLLKTMKEAKKLTPEERAELKKDFDITIDI